MVDLLQNATVQAVGIQRKHPERHEAHVAHREYATRLFQSVCIIATNAP